ncbi:uncharacterized protein [Littorina saxatilis]
MTMQTVLVRSLLKSTCSRNRGASVPRQVFHRNFTFNISTSGEKRKHISTLQCESTRTLPHMPVVPKKCQAVSRNKCFMHTVVTQTGEINARLKLQQQSAFVSSKLFGKNFSVSVQADNHFGLGKSDKSSELHSGKASSVRGDWGVRLSNDNAYLSWCRNTYLSTVVGIAMMGEGTTVLAQQAGEGAFFLAGMNLSWGTIQFIYNTFHLRQAMGMSMFGGLLHISFAVIHFILWFMVCMLYIGYSDESDMRAVEEEDRKKKRHKAEE